MNPPRNGPFEPPPMSGTSINPAALSLENTMIVLSAIPACVHAVDDLPDPVVHLSDQVRVHPQPRGIGLVEIGVHLLRRVDVRERDVGEKRLVARWRRA